MDFIQGLIEEIFEALHGDYPDLEVVVVDDGPEDGTMQVLEKIKRDFGDELIVARHLINRGNASAEHTCDILLPILTTVH